MSSRAFRAGLAAALSIAMIGDAAAARAKSHAYAVYDLTDPQHPCRFACPSMGFRV
jgi:hypothetical protein